MAGSIRRILLGALPIVVSGCAHHTPSPVPAAPAPATRFVVTAYCTGSVTALGNKPNLATIAADPRVLPFGTRVRVTGLGERFSRIYTVGDSGGNIRGRRLDVYISSCGEARAFGRRTGQVTRAD